MTIETEVKSFGISNIFIESGIQRIENEYQLDLGHTKSAKTIFDGILNRFELNVQFDARSMAQYYEIFYCIEQQTRSIVSDRLQDKFGLEWWHTKVPEHVRVEVEKRIKAEVEAGIALRSTEPIDYTTFGELSIIVEKCWEHFSDTFHDKKAVKRVLSTLNMLRAPIAHNATFVENEAQRFNLAIEDWMRQQKL